MTIAELKNEPEQKPKQGMYGETPQVEVGAFILCEMTLPPGKSIWIEETGVDGMEFPKDLFETILKEWYDKHF